MGSLSSVGRELIPMLLNTGHSNLILTCLPSEKHEIEKLLINYQRTLNTYKICCLDVNNVSVMQQTLRNQFSEEDHILNFIYTIGTNIIVPSVEMNEEDWDRVMNINLKGFFFAAQSAGKNMIKHGGGQIISISSQHGVVVNNDRAVYCASKSGLIHLTKELAFEWAKYGIRVNVVSPTFIESEKNKSNLNLERNKRRYLQNIPLHKYAAPVDVANAVMFLISEKASMITGQNLLVDGGWCLD